ncbi:MAG: ABC transporter permease [Phycisphaerae bacterium]|nr:ABC transporter permease [Phycisphaerae bacterium]
MTALWSIAKNTFVQTIRQPIFGFLLLVTFLMLTVVNLPLSGWTMGSEYTTSDQRMLENAGLGTLLVAGMFAAAFCASAAVSREIDDKTVLSVISKPVPRSLFVLGKYIGLVLAVTVFYYLSSAAFLMTVRHKVVSNASTPINWPVVVIGVSAFLLAMIVAGLGNYVFGWTFLSSAVITLLITLTAAMVALSMIGVKWELVSVSETFGPEHIRPQLLVGLVLMFEAVLLLVAVAVAASTRLGLILTLLLCVGVLLLGSMLPWLTRRLSESLPGSAPVGWVLPNLTIFYPLDALAANRDISAQAVGMATLYFACYSAGVLALGMSLFHSRQLEGQTSASTLPGAVALISGLGRIGAIGVAILAVILLFRPETYTPWGAVRVAIPIAAAVGGWALFSLFGKGQKLAYWILLGLIVAILLRAGLVWFMPDDVNWLRWDETRTRTLFGAIFAALVLLGLLVPKTRHHFQSR